MAMTWVKAGECGKESSLAARKVGPTKVVFDITTTCERVQALADELGEVDVAHEMSCPLIETRVYTLATGHMCRNSCIVLVQTRTGIRVMSINLLLAEDEAVIWCGPFIVFGLSYGETMARQLGVPFLGRLPLDPRISELCDAGDVETYPTEAFVPIARGLKETAPEPRRSPLQPR